MRRIFHRRSLVILSLALLTSVACAEPVRVFLPSDDNLQWMNFWVAQGAGFFEDQGLEVELVLGGGGGTLYQGGADFAVMPRPNFWSDVGQDRPVLAFANLLQNDQINLVVRNSVAEERGLSADMSLAERLAGMQGLKVGVAPGPPPRLDLLFQSVGLDADSDIQKVNVPGPQQNKAYADGRVDALYAHTPFLEKALVDQDAVMIVNQSAGEVPGLANRNIHVLATTRSYAAENPETVVAMASAVYDAQRLIHRDAQATADAIRASQVQLQEPQGLETIIGIYQPAIPQTPDLWIGDALQEIDLLPAHRTFPDLSGVDVTAHFDNKFANEAVAVTFGDFDVNGTLDVADIDALSAAVLTANNLPRFDVNEDKVVDNMDRITWVEELRGTYIGDSNLDGEFDTRDLVAVFQAAEYEDGIAGNSGWAEGDWNGDGEFDTGDLTAAFQDGGFEKGLRRDVVSVPEPTTTLPTTFVMVCMILSCGRAGAFCTKLRLRFCCRPTTH